MYARKQSQVEGKSSLRSSVLARNWSIMSLVLATRALGIAGFAASLSAPYCLRPPLSHADEKSQRLNADGLLWAELYGGVELLPPGATEKYHPAHSVGVYIGAAWRSTGPRGLWPWSVPERAFLSPFSPRAGCGCGFRASTKESQRQSETKEKTGLPTATANTPRQV